VSFVDCRFTGWLDERDIVDDGGHFWFSSLGFLCLWFVSGSCTTRFGPFAAFGLLLGSYNKGNPYMRKNGLSVNNE
jgi:hypothetical protein